MKNRANLLFTTILCAAGLVACGGNGGSGETLSIEYVDAGFGQTPYEAVKEAFEKAHPDIKVKLVPNRSMSQTCETRLRQGKASDIMIYDRTFDKVRMWAYQGLVMDLTETFNEDIGDGTTVLSRMDENAKKLGKFQNKYYGYPLYYNVSGFVYDSNLFAANGWNVPKTTKELKDLANTIKNSSVKEKGTTNTISPFIYAAEDHYLYLADKGWDVSYSGTDIMDNFFKYETKDVFKPSNRIGFQKGLELVDGLLLNDDYTYKTSGEIEYISAQVKLFRQGAAMMPNGTWFETEMKEEIELQPNCSMKMFAFPQVSDDNNVVTRPSGYKCEEGKEGVVEADFNENLFVPKACKHPEWAKTFMKWFATEEGCKAWTKNSSAIRPFNLSKSNNYLDGIYNEVTDFCKSVIDISKQYQLYYCNSDSLMSVCEQASYRPAGYYFSNLRSGKTPAECSNGDYLTASREWSSWVEKTKQTFPDLDFSL
ncbi:MAG: ABC transporter substrate-binding protein [Bacilli bacterium]|nr:ABC transporter substrate-binding protein [Bacilli bacterium]